jgi:hypothetical protein
MKIGKRKEYWDVEFNGNICRKMRRQARQQSEAKFVFPRKRFLDSLDNAIYQLSSEIPVLPGGM